eukprot:CAMPEP_0202058950 /NCGR_PEP_ID=MMETSP0963-20130614/33689_1 /ASSEMBLY_ACC=CAM_ASM_000494 /TAXON_ID=4773 /ORGANISM="Schizochytrium aggregatum, Strain ATCC28209" /LENGTH=67 /DNA_ID=CAMNT_0048624963 /DNA_START=95 /DNA_END=299 /DNA_ORIENTATION=+
MASQAQRQMLDAGSVHDCDVIPAAAPGNAAPAPPGQIMSRETLEPTSSAGSAARSPCTGPSIQLDMF